jgi:hypothetical protein
LFLQLTLLFAQNGNPGNLIGSSTINPATKPGEFKQDRRQSVGCTGHSE